MSNLSNATIEGFVTRPPESKITKSGKSLCTFSVAVNHYYKKDVEPSVSFYDVETWDKLAEICSDHVKKGKKLMVMGMLKQDRWQNDEGKTRSRIKIIGREIRFLEIPGAEAKAS
jgi:single-strand DNA-binding protein